MASGLSPRPGSEDHSEVLPEQLPASDPERVTVSDGDSPDPLASVHGPSDSAPAAGVSETAAPNETTAPEETSQATGPGEGPKTDAAPSAAAKQTRKGRRFGFVRELPFLLVVAFALALLIKTFLIQAFFIPSESMQNTLNPGDRVLVNKVVYHLHPPRRGDIIVFSDPNPVSTGDRNPAQAFWHWLTEGLGVSANAEKDFIKRVVGLPGETVEGKDGLVYVDGRPLDEPYVRAKDARPFGPVQVPPDSLFVMGDNRTDSKDSRYGLGFIPYDNVIGRAFVVIWPPSRIGWLRGP